MIARLLLLSLSLLVAACSGGSGAGDASLTTPSGPVLLIDGDAASSAHVSARLAVVALERTDGEVTANLLRENAVVTLASPDGGTSGLPLTAIPAGEYVALHLYFVAGSAVETDQNGGRETLQFEQLHDRLPIGRANLRAGASPWVVVGHAAQLTIERQGDERRVRHALWARLDEPHIVRDLEVRVLAVDRDNAKAVAEVPVLSGLMVDLDFDGAERLVWDDAVLSVDEFLARVEIGTELRIDALLVAWRMLRVIEAERATGSGGGSGVDPRAKTEVLATILDVRPAAGAFGEVGIRVQLVRKGVENLPSERPLDLTLRFDERTKVKLLSGHARHDSRGGPRSRYGDIGDLAAGQTVKAKWRGGLDGRTVTAERIDIVAPGLGDQVHRWFEGRVTALDAPNDRFEIELAGLTARETIDASGAILVGTDPAGALVLLEVGDLLLGDVAAALGIRAEDGSIRADLVRRR